MPYCSTCGQQVEESASYCSKCGGDLGQASPAETVPSEPTNPQPVLDVSEPPPWLGWLALPAAFAFYVVGIGLYSVWAYRRGKRDGFGADTELEPSTQIGLATFGWSLALFVPILNWYALVHLPTMWYKHGFVMGASSDSAPSPSLTSVSAVLAGLVAAFVVTGAVLIAGTLSEGGGAPTATNSLNRVEVRQRVLQQIQGCADAWIFQVGVTIRYFPINDAWTVKITNTNYSWVVDDDTGRVESTGDPFPCTPIN